MDEDDDLMDEDEHDARMRELVYWASDDHSDDREGDDHLLAFARDDDE